MDMVALDQAMKAVCPVDGIYVGDPQDKSTWRIDFKAEATEQQRYECRQVVADFEVLP